MENKFSPILVEWPKTISKEIQELLYSKKKKPLILPTGAKKVVQCIDSCTNGNHIVGCLNLIRSYCNIVARDAPQHYVHLKIHLLERLVKKSNDLIKEIREELEQIKTEIK